MSRFENIQKGKKARKKTEFPALLDRVAGESPIFLDLVVLTGTEAAGALSAATAYARSCGVSDPKKDDPHYDLGLMVHTLARACVDHDVPGSFSFFFCPPDDPENFDKAATTILQNLDTERIHFLYQQQQIWQEECSPWGGAADEQTILGYLFKLREVSDPALPFRHMRLATVGSLLLTTVKLYATLLEDKLGPGSFSSLSSTGSTSEKSPSDPS